VVEGLDTRRVGKIKVHKSKVALSISIKQLLLLVEHPLEGSDSICLSDADVWNNLLNLPLPV